MINGVTDKLLEKNISIAFAESCTGGALSSALTKIPGVSKIFKGSFVTYSDLYKHKYLKVKKKTIKDYGVVSKEVAQEMVQGLFKKTKADISVSVTGNAGPTKGDLNEPIGRIYVGLLLKGDEDIFELNLSGEREKIINDIVEFVFSKINELI